MADYQYKHFAASTDFKVGEAIAYLKSNGCTIRVFWEALGDEPNVRRVERRRIRDFQLSGYHLHNSFNSYDYAAADQHTELQEIQLFCDMLLRQAEPDVTLSQKEGSG
jgi:nitric oxide synthase oxygenase domain/subunit